MEASLKNVITVLEEMGLEAISYGTFLRIYKPEALDGNGIEGKIFNVVTILDEKGNQTREIYSDCPVLAWYTREGKVVLECWEWVPGPGPGDFELEMEEAEAFAFVKSFFFGQNSYFEAKKAYYLAENRR